MSAESAKYLFVRYAAAVLPLITKDSAGNLGTGTAFHVGEGSFVTAKHVVEGSAECGIEVDVFRHDKLIQKKGFFEDFSNTRKILIEPLLHPDESKDVAVFSVPELADLPSIPLGGHLDDWIDDDQFVLNEVLVLGFPRIPLSVRNILIASRGQVNAVVDLMNVPHVHFIVSTTARGGFSGGAVLSEWGVAMGVVTSSLLFDGAPEELGYLTVLSVEPVLECLGKYSLLPSKDKQLWEGLFDN